MRKIFLASVAAFALATTLGGVAMAASISAPVDTSTAPNGKVYICHFRPAHEGDSLITGEGFGCENRGGKIRLVNDRSLGGHGLAP